MFHIHAKILAGQEGVFLNNCSNKFLVHTKSCAKTELHFSARPLRYSTLFSAIFLLSFSIKSMFSINSVGTGYGF